MHSSYLKNQTGSSLIILTCMFPIFITISLIFFQCVSILRIQQDIRTACIKSQSKTFLSISKIIIQLESMNKKAISLRLQNKNAIRRLQIALASGNPTAIGLARAHLALIEMKRALLNSQQLALFSQGKSIISFQNSSEQIETNLIMEKFKKTLIGFFKFTLILDPQQQKLSSKSIQFYPDQKDIAPAYYPHTDFTEVQALRRKWILTYSPVGFVQNFSQLSFKYSFECSTSLKRKNNIWEIITRKV